MKANSNPMAVLNPNEVRWIKSNKNMYSVPAMSRYLGVSRNTIHNIIKDISWRHIKADDTTPINEDAVTARAVLRDAGDKSVLEEGLLV